jgi:putative nucleotidyltransferase with HDIG domain
MTGEMPVSSRRSRDLQSSNVRPAALAAAAIGLPAAVLAAVGGQVPADRYVMHMVAVGATMLIAGLAAVLLTRAGARRGDVRAVTVGTAFAAMAALLLIHAVATPEVFLDEDQTGLLAFAGGATLPVGAAILCLAAHPRLRGPAALPVLRRLQVVLVAWILALGATGLIDPALVPAQPEARGGPALATLVITLGLFALLVRRAWRTFSLTRRGADLSVCIGLGWLALALAAAMYWSPWSVAWWGSHILETVGMLAIGIPVALDLRRDAPSRPLSGDLSAADLVAAEEALLGPQVRALMVRLAEKDSSTAQHTRRVALLAVQLGERLGVPPGRLRALAIGGLLHDIGKLRVSDTLLRKPDRLTEPEFATIRWHPAWGDDLAGALGFPPAVRQLIRSHHERLDGAGYPDGATDLGLDVRILTVCDVYDALVSERVYRAAMSPEDALLILDSERGTAFDPECVDALRELVGAGTLVAA